MRGLAAGKRVGYLFLVSSPFFFFHLTVTLFLCFLVLQSPPTTNCHACGFKDSYRGHNAGFFSFFFLLLIIIYLFFLKKRKIRDVNVHNGTNNLFRVVTNRIITHQSQPSTFFSLSLIFKVLSHTLL